MRRIAIALLAIACTPNPVVDTRDPVVMSAAAPKVCNQSSCDSVCQNGKAMKTTPTAILACAVYLACACGPKPGPVPPPGGAGGQPSAAGGATGDGGSAGSGALSDCQRACSNLASLGCPEDQSTCVSQCELLTKDDRFGLSLSCRINAKTKTDAQKCGPASCR